MPDLKSKSTWIGRRRRMIMCNVSPTKETLLARKQMKISECKQGHKS